MQSDHLLPWKPVGALCFVRELPVEQKGMIIAGYDLNKSVKDSPILCGIVEAVGPKVTDVKRGDRVWFEIGVGEFRMPGDDMVRIMFEEDIAAVEYCDPCVPCHSSPTDCNGPSECSLYKQRTGEVNHG